MVEKDKKTNHVLRQLKKKMKKNVKKDFYTEFFYLNKERKVIEFLSQENKLYIEEFFKEFIPSEFREFVNLSLLNDVEEDIKTWYFEEENLILVININWGKKKQEISIELNIENFIITSVSDDGTIMKEIDYTLFNEFLISFLKRQASQLSKTYQTLSKRRECNTA